MQSYEIRVEGHLDAQWTDWFDSLSITQEAGGTTLLSGPVPDQPALHGLLRKIRDLGLKLISVSQIPGQDYTSSKGKGFLKMHVISQRNAALIAGFSLLVMFFAAMFANFAVLEGLLVPDDAQATVSNILAHLTLFRVGIVAFLVVLVCDVLAAWSLFIFFEPADSSISRLASWFRLVYTALFGAALFGLVSILRMVSDPVLTTLLEPAQLHSQVMLFFGEFDAAWTFSLVLFGAHLSALGILITRTGHAPKWIGLALLLAAAGYLADSLAQFLLPTYADYETIFLMLVAIPGILGELSLSLWLLFKGGKGK